MDQVLTFTLLARHLWTIEQLEQSIAAFGARIQGNESGLTRRYAEELGQVIWVPACDFPAQLDAALFLD